jgi:hypothetical protein
MVVSLGSRDSLENVYFHVMRPFCCLAIVVLCVRHPIHTPSLTLTRKKVLFVSQKTEKKQTWQDEEN